MGKKVGIIGGGSLVGAQKILDRIARTDIGMAIAMNEEVKLKECHKTDDQKKAEVLSKLRSRIPEGIFEEYLLIQKKKSKLSRAKRDDVVFKINRFISQGILREDEIEILNRK